MITAPRLAPRMGLFALAVLLLVFAAMAPAAKKSQKDEPRGELKVKNNTPRFNLVSWRRPLSSLPDDLELKFRNDYDKAIAVFELKLGNGFKTFCDLILDTGEYIQPGQEFVARYRLPAGQKLGVLGVIFDDGSFDGGVPSFAAFAEYIKNRRLGFRIQLQQISKILRDASSFSNDSQTVEDLAARISKLPTELPGVPDAHFGLHAAKGRAIQDLQDLRHSGKGLASLAADDRFATLTDRYDAELQRLLGVEGRQ